MMSISACPTPTVSMKTSSRPGGVEQQRCLQRGLGETAERAAVGHRADEHAAVEEVLGEADAVAEQRPLGERRGGVDRQHADRAPGLAPRLGERADQRRLAHAGGAGEADDLGLAGVGVDLLHAAPSPPGGRPRRARSRARARGGRRRAGAVRAGGWAHRARNHRRGRSREPIGRPLPTIAARDGASLADAAAEPTAPSSAARRSCAVRAAAAARRPARAAALHARQPHAQARYALLLRSPGAAQAALRQAPADRRPLLHLPRREARDRPRRDAADRPLGVDRARDARSACTRAR